MYLCWAEQSDLNLLHKLAPGQGFVAEAEQLLVEAVGKGEGELLQNIVQPLKQLE